MHLRARLTLLSFLTVGALAGCSASHVADDDGGGLEPDAGPDGCGGPAPICVPACGGDAGVLALCLDGAWICPPGTLDPSTCPPGCSGPPPGADCECVGTRWECASGRCPDGINPWDFPGAECDVEGQTCSNGTTDPCGAFVGCTCEGGHWSCVVAEPDPVCYCGREPTAGDRCNEEGASCGECCPTAGGTGWDPMICVDGRWQPGACPELVCPPVVGACPVDGERVLGTGCTLEGQSCGDGCCGDAIVCEGGLWVEGPALRCVCDPANSFACGEGSCTRDQACTSQCGPDDGIEHSCTPLVGGCDSCDCAAVPAGFRCEERDGAIFFVMDGFCG